MIVCHCLGLTDRALRSAIRDGAGSCSELMQACGAGTGCGGCKPALEEIVSEERLVTLVGSRRSGASVRASQHA